jgi:hypothetical protein
MTMTMMMMMVAAENFLTTMSEIYTNRLYPQKYKGVTIWNLLVDH